MRLRSAAKTHVGLVRANNEDAFLSDDARGLYAVADGMGGHVAGEVASTIAVWRVADVANGSQGQMAKILSSSFELVHEAILNKAVRQPEYRGMGTTLTALAIRGAYATIAHVGDSRLYLVRDGAGEQVTKDHACHVGLLNGLGVAPEFHRGTDIRTVNLRPGDVLILCTDGLSEYVSAQDAANLARDVGQLDAVSPENYCGYLAQALVNYALHRGGNDNVTVVVVAVEE